MISFVKKVFRLLGMEVTKVKRCKHDNEWIMEQDYDVLLDVGASIGKFSIDFLKINPDLIVYAFEPIPESYAILKNTLKAFKNIHYFNTAVGNEDGNIGFNLSSHHTSSSVLKMSETHKTAFPESSGVNITQVKISKLDSLIDVSELKEKRALLKIDVQGYEFEVLNGATEVLKEVDILITELSFIELYKGQKLFDEVYRKLFGSGFTFIGNLSQIYDPHSGKVLQSNAIFRKDH